METLSRCDREPSSVGAVVIDHMVSPNPHKLVALMQVQFRHCGFVPPILLILTAVTFVGRTSWRHRHRTLTGVDFKVLVGRKERCVAPICLHATTLCGPVICVPYWTVYTHGLVLWERNSLVFQICMHPYWRPIHFESKHSQHTFPNVTTFLYIYLHGAMQNQVFLLTVSIFKLLMDNDLCKIPSALAFTMSLFL